MHLLTITPYTLCPITFNLVADRINVDGHFFLAENLICYDVCSVFTQLLLQLVQQ